jgi:hypothetical protein
MNAKRIAHLLFVAALVLLLPSCVDSKTPLSDPDKAKPDDQLMGVWRFRGERGETTYYHVGRAGGKLPASVMDVVSVQHTPDGKINQGELLVFPSTLGEKTYLNAGEIRPEQRTLLEEKGWKQGAVDAYLILRYEIKGDVLTLHVMDGDARKRAIEAGKVKGVVEKDPHGNIRAYFTDTSENLARFVASAGDDLFVKDALRLERVK